MHRFPHRLILFPFLSSFASYPPLFGIHNFHSFCPSLSFSHWYERGELGFSHSLSSSLCPHPPFFFYLSPYPVRFNPVSHGRYMGSCSLCLTLFQRHIPQRDPMDSVAQCTYGHTSAGKHAYSNRHMHTWIYRLSPL